MIRPRWLVAGAVLAVIGGWGTPAAADPARPTDYRSTIDDVTPATDAIEVEVRGGDAFLEITTAEGHEVVVPGYQSEPYLRFDADGTVSRNTRSPATTINNDRFGTDPDEDDDPDADPEWETVASDGRYAWHDHRIHWMSPDPPPAAEGEVVFEWTVPLIVDGEEVEVRGTLLREAGVSPLPWLALAGLLGAGLVLLAWRGSGRSTVLIAAIATGGAGIIATIIGFTEWRTTPAGAGASPLLIALPLLVVVLAAAAVFLWLTNRREPAALAALAAAGLLIGWVVLRLSVLWKPVLPTELPANLDRAAVAVVLAVAGAAAVVLVRARLVRSPAS